QEDAAQVARDVEAAGRRCVLLPTDQRTEAANVALVEDAVEALGGLDVLISNAAFQMGTKGGIEAFTTEQLEQVVETNLYATFWLVKAAVKHLSPGASVAITTSIQAWDPSEPLLDYAATKAALNNLMVNLASELGPKGIRVNA